jgi:predicted DnaQ family exonuclease/DinG family helicase
MDRLSLLKTVQLSKFVALDFETTGLQVETDRVIEVAAILFVDGEPAERFVSLVNPGISIPSFIEEITGITNGMVADAPAESKIVDDLFKFIGKHPLVAHNTPFDLAYLQAMADRHDKKLHDRRLYDTLPLSRALLFFQPAHNLSAASDFFSLSTDGAHRAEYDTENCGKIFVELIEEAASYNLDLISRILALLKPFQIQNKDLFIDLANALTKIGDLKNGLTESKIPKPSNANFYINEGENDITKLTSYDVFGPDGHLNQSYENYEDRPNQVNYSDFIDEIMGSSSGVGIAEAGTGLGKSMAYLFAAMKNNLSNPDDGPVVISCYTKHLQDQLFNKDLPQLTKAINAPIQAVVMKGRSNYVCKSRLNWLIGGAEKMLNGEEAMYLLSLMIWLEHTETGDMDECPGFTNGFTFRLMALVQSEPGFCTSPICSRHGGCFFGPLRKMVYNANLIVVNHALLLSEAKARKEAGEGMGFLPEHKSVVIDEAHNIPQAAYRQFTSVLDQRSLGYFLERVDPEHSHSVRWNNQLKSLGGLHLQFEGMRRELGLAVGSCRESIKCFFDQMSGNSLHKFDPGAKYSTKLIIQNLTEEFGVLSVDIEKMNRGFHAVRNQVRKFREALMDIDEKREDFQELHQLFDRGEGLMTDSLLLIQSLTSNQDDECVYWYEGNFKNFRGKTQLVLTIQAAPVDLGDDLTKGLFKELDHCILTSATIRTDSSFDYFLQRTGLNGVEFDNLKTAVFESPFLYNEQVTYYQYSANDGQKPDVLANMIYACHQRYNKRMMVLFTSRAQLVSTYDILQRKSGGKSLPIFAQKRQSSRAGLVRGMHQSSNGILLGTNAFWEGVDLPGDLLEVLIIVKMPFDVPTEPLVKAYGNMIESEGGNRFMDYALPESVIRFRQGFGRLIRTAYDEGIFIVMDDRIVNKRYGSAFSEAIPVDMKIFNHVDSLV